MQRPHSPQVSYGYSQVPPPGDYMAQQPQPSHQGYQTTPGGPPTGQYPQNEYGIPAVQTPQGQLVPPGQYGLDSRYSPYQSSPGSPSQQPYQEPYQQPYQQQPLPDYGHSQVFRSEQGLAPPPLRSRSHSQSSRHSHASHTSRHSHQSQHSRHSHRSQHIERRPTFGDTLMLIWNSFKGAWDSRKP